MIKIKIFNKIIPALLLSFSILTVVSYDAVYACHYDEKKHTYYCKSEDGANAACLSYASHVRVYTHLTNSGLDRLTQNRHLKTLKVQNVSNFDRKLLNKYYLKLCKNDIGLAAVLFSHENRDDSIGNDGTFLYKKVVKKLCQGLTVNRSCASVVSAALVAAGITDYTSASVAGLLSYFNSSKEWKDLGRLREDELKSGDIIYIDRRSHASSYKSGKNADSEENAAAASNRTGTIVHDHVLVWTGNETIRRFFPNSNGNSVSGSYSENYKAARSAAIGTYDMSGDYHVYRHISNK